MRDRKETANLLFSFSALGAAGIAIFELWSLKTIDISLYSLVVNINSHSNIHFTDFINLVYLCLFRNCKKMAGILDYSIMDGCPYN